MANQRDLKAFVRYDGSGRVVAGSLVLRKKKPKVGKWQEILTYECCNDTPTTTTTTTVVPTTSTTTTASPSTTTTTTITSYLQVVRVSDVSASDACTNTEIQNINVYSSKPYGQVTNGDILYYNSNLTGVVYSSYIAFPGLGIVFQTGNGILGNQQSCY